jgi:hypothetical protein
MKTMRWPGLCVAGLGLSLAVLSGCQAWTSTTYQTLPSGRYLQHPPQYIPPSPPFPLPRELAAQEAAAAAAAAAAANGGAVPPPPAVPQVPAPEAGPAGPPPIPPPGM